jgi:hypothetical protein
MKKINKTANPFIFSLFAALVAMPVFVYGQKSFTLDNAIAESMDYFSGRLLPNAKIAVLKVEAPNNELTDYITVECENYILTNTPQTLANKKGLVAILKQRNITDINKAADSDVLSAGRLLGAKAVMIIEFVKRDGEYRFLIQGFDTETSQSKGTFALKVELDAVLADFMGEVYIPPSKNSDAMSLRKELSEIKTELTEIKTLINAQPQVLAEIFSESQDIAEPEPIEVEKTADKRYFVFSLRGEFRPIDSIVGGNIEFGSIGENGFYFSVGGDGGRSIESSKEYYYGGELNFGGCFNKDGGVKNVLGVAAGFWRDNNTDYYAFGDVFWKLMFGRTGNFDITNKALFGMKGSSGSIVDGDFAVVYSLSVGFTLTKSNKR